METSKLCLQCPAPLVPGRRKFCSHKCAMNWHNERQVWSERADRERHNARKKNRYWEDPEAARARMQKWRDEHPDMQKVIERRNRVENAEAIKQQSAEWRERNREHLRDRAQLFHLQTRQKTPWKDILRSAFRRALEKGLPFDLTPEWAASRWTGQCEVTDIPFTLTNTKSGFYSPSIDKIEPLKGYVQGNCRFVLFSVNSFKGPGTDEDMLVVARAIMAKLLILH
jgi:hypothetical protein